MRISIATHVHCTISGRGDELANNPSHSIIASLIGNSRVNSKRSHRLHRTTSAESMQNGTPTYKPYIWGSTPADCIVSCNTGSTDLRSVLCILLHVWIIGETYGFKLIGPPESDSGKVGSRHSYQWEMLRINEENSAQESADTQDREHNSENKGSCPDDSDSATESKSIAKDIIYASA